MTGSSLLFADPQVERARVLAVHSEQGVQRGGVIGGLSAAREPLLPLQLARRGRGPRPRRHAAHTHRRQRAHRLAVATQRA